MNTVGFQVKCVSGYWDQRFMNEDGLEGVRGMTGGKKAVCSSRVLWEWEQKVKTGHSRFAKELGMRLVAWTSRNGRFAVSPPASLSNLAREFPGSTCWS